MNTNQIGRDRAWNLAQELSFVSGLGKHSTAMKPSLRLLLTRYLASLGKRAAWWPGVNEGQKQAVRVAVLKRLDEIKEAQ